ncbi:MAG: metallophosphoesterase [Planctomycetota bacterium]
MIRTPSSFIEKNATQILLENRWGSHFVKERLAQEDRLQRGELPIRFFAHEIEESHHAFKIITLFLRLLELYPVGIKNALNIQTTYQRFALSSLPKQFQPLRILQLSDLHIDGYRGFGHHLRKKIEPLEFDLAIITGDYSFDLTQGFEETYQELLALIPALDCRYGVYGILGNHDSLYSVSKLEGLGIQMLVNERVQIRTPEGDFWLIGVDDPHHFQLHNLSKALEGVPPQEPSILLSHSPELISQASQMGIDLYLTGHTHGGQFCLPGGLSLFANARCDRRYIRGRWFHENMSGYTTSGTGSSGIFARFNCPPEVCIHTLVPLEPA